MKLYLPWIYSIFFILQDGNTSLVHAETRIHKEEDGRNITVGCPFSLYGSRRVFCKQTCDNGNILIETTKNTAQRGRYSVEYKEGVFLSQKSILYVTITQLERSDSGLYRCSLGRLGVKFLDSNYDFQILVTNEPKFTLTPFSVSTFSLSASTPATTTVCSTVSSSSSETFIQSTPQLGSSGTLLYAVLILLAMIILLSVALLIFCKKRKIAQPKGPPEDAEYADITDAECLYEEIREEDTPSSTSPVEVHSFYTTAKCPQPDRDASTDNSSLITSSQNTADEDSDKHEYSEVNSSPTAATSNSPCDYTNMPVVFSLAKHTEDTLSPLYSTLDLH